MWVLQALAIMLSIQAGTLDLVETPPVVGNLPVAMPVPLNLPVGGLSPPVLKGPVNHQMLPPKRPVPPPKGAKCAPAARYFLSSDKLHDCKWDLFYLLSWVLSTLSRGCSILSLGGVQSTFWASGFKHHDAVTSTWGLESQGTLGHTYKFWCSKRLNLDHPNTLG